MSDIDEVKSRLNIVDIIGAKVKLKRAGRNFKGLCPFHNEKTPSFMVNPDRQVFHCFGCAKGGSVIDFVMEYEHLDFVEALEDLAEIAGVKLERKSSDTPEAALKNKLFEVNHLASEYFKYILVSHKLGEQARAYLKSRGVSEKIIESFGLGYSPNSWEALSGYLKKKGYGENFLTQAGLLVPSARGGYDRFRGRVMFTLRDHRGNVVGFSGRLLDADAKEAKYINTSETPVYSKSNVLYGLDVTKAAIQKTGEAVVMEGEFDVLSSYQAGIANVVAIKGSALTEGHIRLLKRYTENITFALDSDLAGDAASRRGIELAEQAGLNLKVIELPLGKDPDDVVRTSPGLLKKAVTEALPIYDYLIKSSRSRHDETSALGKKKISDEIIPFLTRIENSVVQAHYVKKVSDILGVTEESVTDGMKKYTRNLASARRTTQAAPEEIKRSRTERLESYVLTWILQGKTREHLEEFLENLQPEDMQSTAIRKLLENLKRFTEQSTVFLLKDFVDQVPPELAPTLDEALLWDISQYDGDEEHSAREWTKALNELRQLVLRQNIRTLMTKLTLEGADGADMDTDDIQKLLTKYTGELTALEKSKRI